MDEANVSIGKLVQKSSVII